jgi:hypothetical protein
MEVHHHAHPSPKKWTHYFWEFLMLFLAVFCGFLAENLREHKVEREGGNNMPFPFTRILKPTQRIFPGLLL